MLQVMIVMIRSRILIVLKHYCISFSRPYVKDPVFSRYLFGWTQLVENSRAVFGFLAEPFIPRETILFTFFLF